MDDPTSTADPWTEKMRRGEFAAAWAVSDAALRARAGVPCWHLPRHFQYIWDGSSLAGRRVLVRCYHGLGDTIQFIRYLPLLRRLAAETIVWAQPKLLPLVATVPGVDRLLPLHDGAPEVAYDVDVELMELPHVFRTTLETLPAEVPYLRVEPAAIPHRGRLRVGLVWRAGEWDQRRSLAWSELTPITALEGIDWYILQGRPGLAERPEGFGVVAGADSLVEAAQVIRALDLVLSVDSMAAHLAGALATPVWTLLPTHADWRWLDGRTDSPWYPTMRLFRQPRPGDWQSVVEQVARALAGLCHSPARTDTSGFPP